MFNAKSRGAGQSGAEGTGAGQVPGKPSVLAAGLRIRGDIEGEGDLVVEGRLEGSIACSSLTVGEGSEVVGTIRAEAVLLRGRIEGEVEADRVTLARTARMFGDVRHKVLTVETGAEVVGRYSRIDPGPADSKAVLPVRQDMRALSSKGSPPVRPDADATVDLPAVVAGEAKPASDTVEVKQPLH